MSLLALIKEAGVSLERLQYSKRFFESSLPIANLDRMKSFIADQFGFDRFYINVLRSKDGHVCYPLYQDKKNNYIVFSVKDHIYSCINGRLELLDEGG
jgi:hypothetical protein